VEGLGAKWWFINVLCFDSINEKSPVIKERLYLGESDEEHQEL
jgi:hypothetical protein